MTMQHSCDVNAGHLAERLAAAGVKGRHLTLKIKRKKVNAPQPYKFLVQNPAFHFQCNASPAAYVSAVVFKSCNPVCFQLLCAHWLICDCTLYTNLRL